MRTVDLRFGCEWMLVALLVAAGGAERNFAAASEEAYVTLLYGDEFLLGVRVLGKSIRDTGTTKDTVVLVSDGVSDYGKSLLQADGWIVKPISLLANPNLKRPKRFWGVYTKLKIFDMTMYKKVVYLDADTIVVKSIEDLFKCGEFCANLKHSERLNSGVMVVKPSESVFKDMMAKVDVLPSYTGGDQGFLNSYFPDFANARLFEPNLTLEERESRGVRKIERLSTLYNADVGLYMLANKWMVDERELRVIHYTLGPLKPWDWWTSWLLKPVDVWQNVRDSLKESLPGTAGGTSYQEQLEVKVLFLIPLCVFFFVFFRSRTQIRDSLHGLRNSVQDYARCLEFPLFCSSTTLSSITNSGNLVSNWIHPKIPTNLGPISIFVCYVSAAASLGIAFMLIPRQVTPWTGILLMYEWTFLGFIIFFGGYLRLVSHWGRLAGALPSHSETEAYDSGKGHQRQNISEIGIGAWSYGLRMAVLAVVAPSLPCIFGISALFARLGLMVGGGMALSSFMTYASEKMAFKAFTRGLEEHDYRRTRVFSYWI